MSSGRRQSPLLVVAIAVLVSAFAGFFWLVTTFLFAFSGGQYRMVPVVGYGALAVLIVPLIAAAVAWRLSSPTRALVVAIITSGAVAGVAGSVEFVLSFFLGASGGPPPP